MFRQSLLSVGLLLVGVCGLVAAQAAPKAAPPLAPMTAPQDAWSYRDVVKKVLPAVVSIESTWAPVAQTAKPAPKRPSLPEHAQTPDEIRKFMEQFLTQPFGGQLFEMPDQAPRHGFGSGFLVDAKGVILTNDHVVDGARQVKIRLQDGREFVSKDIKTDPQTDLAVVRIDAPSPLPYLELGDSDAMQIGDRVLAVGAPFGLAGSVTAGIISGEGRSLHANANENFLQTDAAINPGNSGGPLVNMAGQVIGVNTAIRSSTGGSQGVGLAIPSSLAKSIMEQLLKNGVVRRAYLGVYVRSLEQDVAARLGVADGTGVVVAQVVDGSPAAKAGMQPGDVLTTVGGKTITSGGQLQQLVAALPLDKPVEVGVVRDGKPKTFEATVEQQPKANASNSNVSPETPQADKNAVMLDKIGVQLQDMTPELAKQFGFPEKTTAR